MNAALQTATSAQLLAELGAVLPQECLLVTPEQVAPFECDGLSAFRQLPLAVVLPEDERQVQQVLQICHRHRAPVVARGAGTGLSGGAMPCAHGLVLGLSKLNRILNIDP